MRLLLTCCLCGSTCLAIGACDSGESPSDASTGPDAGNPSIVEPTPPTDGGTSADAGAPSIDDELDDTGLPSGTHDLRYGTQGVVTGTSATMPLFAFSRKGRAVVLERETKSSLELTVVLANGKPDTSFGGSGKRSVTLPETASFDEAATAHAIVNDDGTVIVAGDRAKTNGAKRSPFVTRLKAGALDPSFATGGVWELDEAAMVSWVTPSRDALGAVTAYYVAVFAVPTGTKEPRIFRLDANGKIDPTFGTGGVVAGIAGWVTGVDALERPLVLSRASATTRVQRLSKNGSADTTWGTNGTVELVPGLAGATVYGATADLASDGSLWVSQDYRPASQSGRVSLHRFDASGAPIDAFPGEKVRERPGDWRPLGLVGTKLVLETHPKTNAGAVPEVIERWTPDGTLDASYAKAGKADLSALCTFGDRPWSNTALTHTGALVFASVQSTGGKTIVWRLRRLTR